MHPFKSRRKKLITLLIIIITGLSGKLFAQQYSAAVNAKIKQVENGLSGQVLIEGTKDRNLHKLTLYQNGEKVDCMKK